jgi:hypothetical protein
MQVEQAVFTSARTRRMRGYHLVARSGGIADPLAAELSRWCPTHASLLDTEVTATSVNYFSPAKNWVAVTRSIYGGPEYSERGGLQIVTRILMLRRDQMAGYENNPLALCRAAFALGHLRLTNDLPDHLPTVEIPEETWIGSAPYKANQTASPSLLDDAQRLLDDQQRVALIGLADPLAAVERLIRRTPIEQRLDLSFTSGLKPSVDRRFRLHLLKSADTASRRRLASLGIQCVSA